jgi:hypothetical protein
MAWGQKPSTELSMGQDGERVRRAPRRCQCTGLPSADKIPMVPLDKRVVRRYYRCHIGLLMASRNVLAWAQHDHPKSPCRPSASPRAGPSPYRSRPHQKGFE